MKPIPTRRRRLTVMPLLLLALCASLLSGCGRFGEDKDDRYVTAPVERGDLVARVTATGTLSALVTVQVGSQVSGRIAELLADFNTPVKKGQVIARIDPRLFEAAVGQARANLLAAEGNLAKARADAADAQRKLDRARALQVARVVSRADLDSAQAAADAARGQVSASEGAAAQARAALREAEINLDYTTIVSPTDGVVIARNVDAGQTVAASLQAPTLFLIAQDLTKMQVDTSVAEADVGKLRPGMTGTFTVDAYPGEPFRGVVRQIRNAPETKLNVVTYDAVLDVANKDLRLRPGMTANVTFAVEEHQAVLRVPNAALRFSLPGKARDSAAPRRDRRPVWVMRDGEPVRVEIFTGITDGSFTEVLDGDLRSGEKVITDSNEPSPGPGGGRLPMRGVF